MPIQYLNEDFVNEVRVTFMKKIQIKYSEIHCYRCLVSTFIHVQRVSYSRYVCVIYNILDLPLLIYKRNAEKRKHFLFCMQDENY